MTVTTSVSLPLPPSSSVTVTVTVNTPLSAYVWLPETVPETIVPPSTVPSPQLMVAVCVSSVPTSLNVAGSRLTVPPSSIVWLAPASTVGSALVTVTSWVSVIDSDGVAVSLTVTVIVYVSSASSSA